MSHWTDNIPTDWDMETLKDSVCNIVDNRGKTCPTSSTGIPLIATNCIKEFGLYPVFEKVRFIDDNTYKDWFRGHPNPNDILFVNKGAPGGVCVVPDPVPFCIAQDMVALRADPEKFGWKYLFAALRSNFVRSQIQALNVGTSIPHLKKTDFDRIIIPKPHLNDQKIIGDIYFSLSEKIELNLQMNKTLEEMAMALYKHWFVDFGPIQNGKFIESELGMIPESWEVKSILEIANLLSGGTPKTTVSEYWGGDVNWVSAKDIGNGGVIYINETEKTITESGVLNSSTKILPADTVILVARGSVGKYGMIAKPMAMNQSCYGLYSKCEFSQGLVYLMFSGLIEQFKKMAYGSVFDTITTSTFATTKVIFPPANIINELKDLVDPLFVQMKENVLQNQSLTTLRDTLLPKLISGEVRVKDVENLVEASL